MFQPLQRRGFFKQGLLLATALSGIQIRADKPAPRHWTLNLMGGMIGVQGDQLQLIELAARHGFESVEPKANYLARLSPEETEDVLKLLDQKRLVFGAASLPVDFRGAEEKFQEGLQELPRVGEGLRRAGVTRVGTWISPGSAELTFRQNFRLHQRRLGAIAEILADYGLRFGLEYVGTKTSRDRFKFEFIHTMAETKELIGEIGAKNVGFVLDTWHWWQAGENAADILTLREEQIVAVDLNDAPAGIAKEQQADGRRELPLATGVIEVKPFLDALQQLNYTGPVRAEPFNKALNELDNEEACRRTITALKAATKLIS